MTEVGDQAPSDDSRGHKNLILIQTGKDLPISGACAKNTFHNDLGWIAL
jgi:hypothetical protein